MNILYIITDLNIGGTEKMLFETVKGLNKDRFSPYVVGLKKWGMYADNIKQEKIPVIALDMFKFGKLFAPVMLIKSIIKIISIIKKENVKILHTFLFQANMVGRIASIFTKVPAVISSVRVMEKQKNWQLYFDKLTSGMCDRLIVNSDALKKFLTEKGVYSEDKISVIYNGIDTEAVPKVNRQLKLKELGCDSGDILIGTAGRLHEQKGVRYLIEAAGIIYGSLKSNKAIKFIIIGDGPQMNDLRNKAEKSGLKEKVIFTGWRTDALEIISVLDIFVLPSLWEGTPNAVLEAMLCAKPVIMTSVGAADELITDGKDGILVPPRDSARIAREINGLLDDKQRAIKMGENSREKVKRLFDIKEMVRKTEAFYGALKI